MTQEEKARAYDKAFESIKKFLAEFKRRMPKDVFEDAKTIFEDNFPELQESEDERIREEIIKYIKGRKITPNHPIADEWIAWLEKQGQVKESHILQQENKTCCKNGNSLTCKDDTLLDLLHKMPSYITVDGIFYHFMLRKTSLSYMAFYEGEGEGGGKIIFWMTGDPIELLTAMLEKLKEKGLLE